MAGLSREFTNSNTTFGLSDQASVNYYISKHFSLGAFCDFGTFYKWSAYKIANPNNLSLGLTPEYHLRHFFVGVSIEETKLGHYSDYDHEFGYGKSYPPTGLYTPTITSSFGISYGMHFGFTEKLSKHLNLKQQMGFYYSEVLSAHEAWPVYDGNGNLIFKDQSAWQEFFMCHYFIVGISYHW